ncbi:glycosyltransferase family 4 protein [Roseateles koreensis]|uniref:Glycosyltransferase family 4 protein n=1 Tax=Roseateles koreensis TaxID=2987526 RepID=A0ABT5KUU5_9BURK|nr:glycosyltransferase family 4 protein [Roseateles koreensis]MDC8786689.1 glycosyltransferase family 4 protein [Roseateles koreensis]
MVGEKHYVGMQNERPVGVNSRVLFAQRRLPHYRVPFLEEARRLLAARGIAFDFIYGEPTLEEASKNDEGHLVWAKRMAVTRYALGGKLCWQPFSTKGYDLVIVSQENRLLINHWLCRPWRGFKLAFFSHGANLSAGNRSSLKEKFRRWTTQRADWMFAYTVLSAKLMTEVGFDSAHITVMNNSVDTHALRADLASVADIDRQALRMRYNLVFGKTGLFLGSMYEGKGLDVLLHTARWVHERDPEFRLLVVGDGPARQAFQRDIAQMPWVHWVGAQRGRDKAGYMAVSDFLLIPGVVGLSILDGFAANLPLLTCKVLGHGPEIAYLEQGKNGLMSESRPADYAQMVGDVCADPTKLTALKEGARLSGQKYSVEAMAKNFVTGICQSLGLLS